MIVARFPIVADVSVLLRVRDLASKASLVASGLANCGVLNQEAQCTYMPQLRTGPGNDYKPGPDRQIC